MSDRSEYFSILSALCVTDDYVEPKKVAEFALRIWEEGEALISFRLCPENLEQDE